MAARQSTPLVSVLLVTPDRYETIRDTVTHLAAQSIAHELELVILVPTRERLDLQHAVLEGFENTTVVELGELTSVAAARARGVPAARAPVVAFAEDHAFPDPGWAEALANRHGEGHAGVGPTLTNANPATAISWVDLFLSYGPFVERAESSRVDSLPADNSSYRVDVLRAHGLQLVELLEDERALQQQLLRDGHTLYLESRARLRHINFSRRLPFLQLRYHGGREYGGRRASAEGWGPLRSLGHALAAPIAVPLQVSPVVRCVRRSARKRELLPRILPDLLLAVGAGIVGETVGYLFGAGRSSAKVTALKFHRTAHVRTEERRRLEGS
jgi:hypothetical protein